MGSHAPFWDRAGLGSKDSAPDDDASIVFETDPFPDRVEILGLPEVDLHVLVDENVGLAAARLLIVSPEGVAHLICRGSRNLLFPDDLSSPELIEPGVGRQVRFSLLASSVVVPKGWRLRLAIAGADFPVAFPPGRRFTLTIDPQRSRLLLPLVPPRPQSSILEIGESPPLPQPNVTDVSHEVDWSVSRRDGMTIYAKRVDGGEVLPDRGDLEIESTMSWSVSVMDDDPNSTRVRFDGRVGYHRPEWSVGTVAAMDLSTDGSFFDLAVELSASHDGREIWQRRWQERIPREWA